MPSADQLARLTGRLWSDALADLEASGFETVGLRIVDITPERAPRTPSQQFAWGELRVVRAAVAQAAQGDALVVTVAREMRLPIEAEAGTVRVAEMEPGAG